MYQPEKPDGDGHTRRNRPAGKFHPVLSELKGEKETNRHGKQVNKTFKRAAEIMETTKPPKC
jgi:hypothetical protein